MTQLELKSKKREIFGKRVKILRRRGIIPAIVYGSGGEGVPIELDLKEFSKVFKIAGETTLIKLFIDNSASKNVLIYDSERDPITGELRHVDFYEVKMDEKIIAKTPLVFVGEAPAVLDLGGVLVKAMQELEVRALPADLPHEIEVDISSLKTFENNIAVKDIKLPKNVEALQNASDSVASVAPPRSESELEELSGEVKEKIEEVAVETEEKVKERQKEEQPGA